ncbi:MAG TPA: Gfo/Idh/MocA family oxidoreductase [Opitutales bacterium]|nr:Gfo/Idh/MocA family oxidoreductase [Opitutales bacterium]
MKDSKFNRRDFLKTGSLGALGLLAGSAIDLTAQPTPQRATDQPEEPVGPPINCAIIGVGAWGRELIGILSATPGAIVHTVCESYPAYLRRATRAAPDAKTTDDYREVLDDAEVQAVFIATPSHQHREIAIAALEAGKHVYCEAPMATTIEDARAIAKAAQSAEGQIFQVGQQFRAAPQHLHVLQFVRTGALGTFLSGRAQWNKKESQRRVSPNAEREKELNWRLNRETSLGLIGEIGIHQVDVASWFFNAPPVAVTGFGDTLFWKDGRNVPDTIQAVFEYPNGVNFTYSATLGNSYDLNNEVFQGSDGSILLRDNLAWMFREPDAPLLGWEVYARKDAFFQQTGISLVADATKLLAQGVDPASGAVEGDAPIYDALEDFLNCIRESRKPYASYKEGFEAVVTAVKANEAILEKKRVTYDDQSFEVG